MATNGKAASAAAVTVQPKDPKAATAAGRKAVSVASPPVLINCAALPVAAVETVPHLHMLALQKTLWWKKLRMAASYCEIRSDWD